MQDMTKVLILGGTTEANQLAGLFADKRIPAIYSYAGRVNKPKKQPIESRVGGFGGVDGLIQYINNNKITHIIDCTHPFAQQMSINAYSAASKNGTKLLSYSRPAWVANADDNWQSVGCISAAVDLLKGDPRRIFLAIGRMHLGEFKSQHQHFYLLRLIDKPTEALFFDNYEAIIDKAPFSVEQEIVLLLTHKIDLVVCKNAGGMASEAKLIAARELNLPVIMIERPVVPTMAIALTPDTVLQWLNHEENLGV